MTRARQAAAGEVDRGEVRARARADVAGFVESLRSEGGEVPPWVPPEEREGHPALARWYSAGPADQAEFVGACLEGALDAISRQAAPDSGPWLKPDPAAAVRDLCLSLIDDLVKKDLPLTEDHVELLAGVCAAHGSMSLSESRCAAIFERAAAAEMLTDRAAASLAGWRRRVANWKWNAIASAAICRRIDALIGPPPEDRWPPPPPPPDKPLSEPKRLWRRLHRAAVETQTRILEGRRCEMDPWLAAEDVLTHPVSDRAPILAMGAAALSWGMHQGVSLIALLRPGRVREDAAALAPEFTRYLDDLFESVATAPDKELAAAFFAPRRPLWQRGGEWHVGLRELADALSVMDRAGPRFTEGFRAYLAAQNAGTDCPVWGRHVEALEDEFTPPSETVVRPGDAWSNRAIAMLDGLASEERGAWLALLRHARESGWARPPARWLAKAAALLEPIGDRAAGEITRWLRLVGRPGTRRQNVYGWPPDQTFLMEGNARVLKGLIWAATCRPTPELASALAEAAVACDQKVLRLGPRNKLVRNACLAALSALPPELGAAQLGRARQLVKYKGSKVMGDRAVRRTAQAAGVAPDELLETAVPTYGLSARGEVDTTIGGCTGRIRIVGPARTRVLWRRGRGGWREEPPAELAAAHGEAVERVGATAREIAQMLAAHRLRLERLLVSDRVWPLPVWRERYHDHPLLAYHTRRLIWRFETAGGAAAAGLWDGRRWTDAAGAAICPGRGARVSLWHPIEAGAEEVLAWRRRLEGGGVVQPFRQAHREVYALTDAERETGVYSNRFAAHVLRAGQLVALMRERGWEGNPAIAFDGATNPRLPLPEHGLSAEFLAEPLDDEPNERGMFELLASDQVRFAAAGTGERVALDRVPARVFSEVMRDVDLFVGVSSVGNNPQWHDGGPEGRFRAYWWEYGFGELAQSGRTRREILVGLLPRLRIGAACTLEEKFLRVRGSLREYRIHLGSGNILMEPDDQYLCIVPNARDDGESGRVFLPFEGDRVLAIILSKAFMLAEDDRIKDPTILSQIRGR